MFSIEAMKESSKIVIHLMKDHTMKGYSNEVNDFKDVVRKMHTASSKEELAEAYTMYINLCLGHSYREDYILAGIIQNEDKNKEFKVNIDNVAKSIIDIKSKSIELDSTNEEKPKSDVLSDMTEKEIIALAEEYDPKDKTNELGSTIYDIMSGDLLGVKNAKRKAAYEWVKAHSDENKPGVDKNPEIKESKPENKPKVKEQLVVPPMPGTVKQAVVQSTAAAHDMSAGFNINNFVKNEQKPVPGVGVPMPVNQTFTQPQPQQVQAKPAIFPHQIDKVSDEDMLEDVSKHYKLIQPVIAPPLYDLVRNKLLAKKMKELNCKHRPNNPHFTQVNINEYIDDPGLLAKFPLAFTLPCNDKGYIIMVLFNPNPEILQNGHIQYPLHVFKAKLTKSNDNK